MSLNNIGLIINDAKTLTNSCNKIMNNIESLAKNVTARDVVYLQYILDNIRDIHKVIDNLHEIADVELNFEKKGDDLK